MRKYIVILFVLTSINLIYSQENIFCLDSVYNYSVGDKVFNVSRVSVINKTNRKLLFWFNNSGTKIKKSLFHDYFFKRIGDFTLYNTIIENGDTLSITDMSNFYVIFKTFYKVIHPWSSFYIYIIDDKTDLSDLDVNKLNIFQTITEDELDNISIPIDDKFEVLSYKPDYIVVMKSLFNSVFE